MLAKDFRSNINFSQRMRGYMFHKRVLEVAKNRHGPSGGTLALQMGKEGLIPLKEVQCI